MTASSPPLPPATTTDMRLEKFLRLRIAHRRQREVSDEVWQLLTSAQHSREITVLVGPTGVGKTNLIESIEQEAGVRFKDLGSPVGRAAHLRVNAAPPQNNTFRFPGLYRGILNAADDYFAQRVHLGRLRTSDELQDAAVKVLKYRSPLVFCIDEAQHITYAVQSARLEQHLDNLKYLADQIPSPMLLVGSRELLRFSLLSAQLARRVRQVPFLPYRPVAAELPAYLGVVKILLDAMPVAFSFLLKNHRDFFFEGGAGSVGLLKQWFNRVVEEAIAVNSNNVTIDDFTRHRMPLGKLTLIAKEYAQMQGQMAQLAGSASALRLALGYPAPTPTATATLTPLAAAAPGEDTDAQVTSPALKPGERVLGRDSVGDAA